LAKTKKKKKNGPKDPLSLGRAFPSPSRAEEGSRDFFSRRDDHDVYGTVDFGNAAVVF
jgi:hypothetical protein